MRHYPLGRKKLYRVTVSYTQTTTAGLTHDITAFSVPAKAIIHEVIADTTVQWAGTAGTLFLRVGTTAGDSDLVTEHDVETATVTRYGLVSPGGLLPSWSAATSVIVRIRSSSGNLGDGTDSLLSAGSTTLYILAEDLA